MPISEKTPCPALLKSPTGIRILRDISLIDSDKKQCPNIFQSGSLHISDKNLIDARRNQRNLGLVKTGLQKLPEILEATVSSPRI